MRRQLQERRLVELCRFLGVKAWRRLDQMTLSPSRVETGRQLQLVVEARKMWMTTARCSDDEDDDDEVNVCLLLSQLNTVTSVLVVCCVELTCRLIFTRTMR